MFGNLPHCKNVLKPSVVAEIMDQELWPGVIHLIQVYSNRFATAMLGTSQEAECMYKQSLMKIGKGTET